jgi:type I pantothenate kinase
MIPRGNKPAMTVHDNYTIHWQGMLDHLRGHFSRRKDKGAYVIGVAGGVAAGKTTFAEMLKARMAEWPERPRIEIVSTDGFLFDNKMLAEKQLSTRKGFPESYDVAALAGAIRGLRNGGKVRVPRYSHVTYDIDPDAALAISGVNIAILDGLHLGRVKRDEAGATLIDQLIYLDADEADIQRWFGERLFPLMVAGRTDPSSFYYMFREMDDAAAHVFVDRVWNGINLPNLREHIVKDREAADLVVRKAADHTVAGVEVR